MVNIDDNRVISLTRGDTLRVTLNIVDDYNNRYVPVIGDVVTFGLKKTINDEVLLIEKNVPINTMELHLDPQDTKNLEYGTYVYDIQIQLSNGDIYTFIPYTNFVITGEVV